MANSGHGKPLGANPAGGNENFLFMACFVALVATSFAFIIRIFVLGTWQAQFGLSATQMGQIQGAGLWPFGVSIVLFSLVIDSLGYGRAMIFAFACHMASALILVNANGYGALYVGSVLNGLAAGTVEAVINPVVATLYPKSKTKMLSFLHAGWPGGMVVGGLLMLLAGGASWKFQVGVVLLPTLIYGAMMLRCKFPIQERVAAGVPYRDMLREAGAIVAFLCLFLICSEVLRIFMPGSESMVKNIAAVLGVIGAIGYFLYTRSLGRPMYVFLVGVMLLLATTELGVDSWVTELVGGELAKKGMHPLTLLLWMQTIMMVLRFCIGPIERALKPLGVLLCSSILAALGLFLFSRPLGGLAILAVGTIYGVGKTFFWPVTLGLVSERFPRGGALTMNAVSGVGMLGVGILGAPFMGYVQDTDIERSIKAENGGVYYAELIDPAQKASLLGTYHSLNVANVNEIEDKVKLYDSRSKPQTDSGVYALVRAAYDHLIGDSRGKSNEEMRAALEAKGAFVDDATYTTLKEKKDLLDRVRGVAKKKTVAAVALFPTIMALCYFGLLMYVRSEGGYKAVELKAEGRASGH